MSEHNTQASALPDWMLEANAEVPEDHGHYGLHFIRRTFKNISEVFTSDFYSERYAAKPQFLQAVDARMKIIVFLAFIIFSNFTHNIAVLAVLSAVPPMYARFSGLPLKSFLRRVWLYVPLLILVVSLPGASSLFVQGKALFGPQNGLYFTAEGLANIFRLSLRAGISLEFSFLLLLTTRWSRIMQGLSNLHVPALFISVCNMAYRYLFVLCGAANDMMEARFLRTVGKVSVRGNREFIGGSIASLFMKSHFLGNEVYSAMCCRGFTGKLPTVGRCKIQRIDLLFLFSSAAALLILAVGELLF